MFPKPTGRVKTQELENRPTEAALRVAAKVALLDGQTEYEFIWNDEAGSCKYMIKLRRSETDSKLIDWGLYRDAEPEAEQLWSHTGSDIADIHARLVSSSTDNNVAGHESDNGNGSGPTSTETQTPEPQAELNAAATAPEQPHEVEPPAQSVDAVEPAEASSIGVDTSEPAPIVSAESSVVSEAPETLEGSSPAEASFTPELSISIAPAPVESAAEPPQTVAPLEAEPVPTVTPAADLRQTGEQTAIASPSEPAPATVTPAADLRQTGEQITIAPTGEPAPATVTPPAVLRQTGEQIAIAPPNEPAPSAEPFAAAEESALPAPSPESAPAPVEHPPVVIAAAEQPPPPAEAPAPAAAPVPAPPSATPFGTLIKHAAKIAQSTDTPKLPPAPPPKAKPQDPDPDYDAQEGNPLSWEEQCRTFDGVDSLPIVEIDRLSRVEEPSELSGDLSDKNITEVLRAIANQVLSGRLSIDSKQKQADIFFFEGAPIHATGSMGEGMEGMLRVVGLEEGHYRFDARMTTDQRTVTLPLETVIFQGAQLADDTRFLTELHLVSDSILVRKNQYLSEKGFEALLSNGEPLDLNLQKSVYLAVDGKTSLKEIVRRLGLTRTQWVPVTANMIRCKVIAPLQVKARAKVNVKPKIVEPELLATVTSKLFNDTSKMLTHPALIFMLEHETNRADIEHPLSLLIFEVGETQSLGGSAEAVPEWALNRISFLISGFKRRTDVFGHYEKSNEFALVMPDVKPTAVQAYAKDWVERVLNDSVIRDIANNLKFHFGIASMPDDALTVPLLLSAAELAKRHSISSGSQVVLAQDLEAVKASRNTPLAPR